MTPPRDEAGVRTLAAAAHSTNHRRMRPLQLAPVPAILRPLVRAYFLGYASAVAPRLLTLLLQQFTRRRRRRQSDVRKRTSRHEPQLRSFVDSALHILRTGLELHRFPAFCAALVGGTTLLQGLVRRIVELSLKGLHVSARIRIARWLSSFVAAWFSLRLLQSNPHQAHSQSEAGRSAQHEEPQSSRSTKLAGRTLDLTLFAATRAVDVLVGELWSQRRDRRVAAQKWTGAEQLISKMTDPLVFVASCGLIMWSWFYTPDRLPRSYNKWITSAASVDLRLIEALRRCREGELRYGEDTGQAPLLGSMCTDFELPYEWGDPAKAIPFPCEIVHMGRGQSCEYHAASRFCRAWKWSMFTYLPLAMAFTLRKHPSRRNLVQALLSASRSSAFLAAFITLFYYGVCLGRTRVGPRVVGRDRAGCQRIDGGLCVGTGCFLCGWSVLVETATRRKDMALFVAPRAMATVVPRRYPLEKQWRETLAFASSTAVVMTCVLENPKRVRGLLGGVLNMVMRE